MNRVKRLFRNSETLRRVSLSSANSSIWELVRRWYIISQLIKSCGSGEIKLGDATDYSSYWKLWRYVAGYLAKQMGLPGSEVGCASNGTMFLKFHWWAHYNKKSTQDIITVHDILVSSNLEATILRVRC